MPLPEKTLDFSGSIKIKYILGPSEYLIYRISRFVDDHTK